jgi:hypothetical protein
MLTDEWAGMRVYRSDACKTWKKPGRILSGPRRRRDDGPSGAHGDVVVIGDKAYLFYYTHPGRTSHSDAPLNEDGGIPYRLRRSSIQVGKLVIEDGTLVCDRNDPFDFLLPGILRDGGQSGNPILEGWYADPEVIIYGKKYWIFPTYYR